MWMPNGSGSLATRWLAVVRRWCLVANLLFCVENIVYSLANIIFLIENVCSSIENIVSSVEKIVSLVEKIIAANTNSNILAEKTGLPSSQRHNSTMDPGKALAEQDTEERKEWTMDSRAGGNDGAAWFPAQTGMTVRHEFPHARE